MECILKTIQKMIVSNPEKNQGNRRLGGLFPLGRLLFDFSLFLLSQAKSGDKGVKRCLQQAKNNFGEGSIDPVLWHRLREYVLLGSALGETFCLLRGQPISKQEKSSFLHSSMFAPFYDDLFDTGEFQELRILEMMASPEDCKPSSFFEAILCEALSIVYENCPNRILFDKLFRELFDAQKQIRNVPLNPGLQKSWTENSLKKGGISAQLYRTLLCHPMREGEDAAFFHLGSLIQFMDDLFDVHEDFVSGRKTLITRSQDMDTLAQWYQRETRECLERFRSLGYHPRDQKRFLFRVNFILSRGSVCLLRFSELQKTHGGVFDPGHFRADQLLIDMEKPKNFLLNLDYCLRFR